MTEGLTHSQRLKLLELTMAIDAIKGDGEPLEPQPADVNLAIRTLRAWAQAHLLSDDLRES